MKKLEELTNEDKTPADNKSFSFKDIMNAIDKKSNPLEKMSLELARTMFDDRKLLMTARMKLGYAKMIIRNMIVNHFFLKYYSKIEARIKLTPAEYPPYYERTVVHIIPNNLTEFQNSFNQFNKDLLKITIAFEGKGRDEIIKILEAQMGSGVNENNGLFGWKKPFG